MSVFDNLAEAVNAVLARPGRAVLVAAGTVAGVAALVAILGLASTARAQISANFNAFTATEVTVTPANDGAVSQMPADSTKLARRINGVVAAGRYWSSSSTAAPSVRTGWDTGHNAEGTLYAADPGALGVLLPHLITGRGFTDSDRASGVPAILLSQAIADQLDIKQVLPSEHVFIGDRPFLVLGIYNDVSRQPETLLGAIIDASTFLIDFGQGAVINPSVIVATGAGSAQVVADQLPVSLRVDNPNALTASAPSSSADLRSSINHSIQQLLLVLAAVAIVIGALSIANGTLVSTVERIPEIGLRRALGARRGDVATQFMFEGAVTGTLGGILGYSFGIIAIVALSRLNGWTPTIDLALSTSAPLVGTITGLAAAAVPAWRTTAVPAVQALRR